MQTEDGFLEAPITREILKQMSAKKEIVKIEKSEDNPYLEQYSLRDTQFWWAISEAHGESISNSFRIRRYNRRYKLVFFWDQTPILESEIEAALPSSGGGMEFLWERVLDAKRVMELRLRI